MKFNLQICTTREQSERLLALGLKKETADCRQRPYTNANGLPSFFADALPPKWEDDIPAWSLHRMIELIDEPEHIARWIGVQIANDYDYTVDCIEWLIKEGQFPKEYLV